MANRSSDIYTASYSGVPVFEFMCRGIAVMRRKHDSYLNATQILKVAGIEKGRRTKILEREVLTGEHEKVQGGYGKYQGTWVPFQRGKDLASHYAVEPHLRALFEYEIPEGGSDTTPTKEMVQAAHKALEGPKTKKASSSPRMSPSLKRARSSSAMPSGSSSQQFYSAPSMTPSPLHPSFNAPSPSVPPSPQWHTEHPPRKRIRTNNSPPPLHDFDDDGPSRPQADSLPVDRHYHSHYSRRQQQHQRPHRKHHPHNGDFYSESEFDHGRLGQRFMDQPLDEPLLQGAEKYRTALMSMFLNDEQELIPDMLTSPTPPEDLDINLIIDDQGHTALHWAAALARIPILDMLVKRQADIRRVNYNGESALVRAVLVTNNFDKQSFPHVLGLLHSAIPLVDRRNRTILHHIAVTAGIRGREASSRYYMECLFEWIARHGGDFASIVDVQDKNGDTALTIAARVGDRYLARILIDVGANRDIENKVGLRAEDFGVGDSLYGPSGPRPPSRPVVPTTNTDSAVTVPPETRSKDLLSVVQKMVDELDLEFSHEIMARQNQLQETQAHLRQATSELSETRRTVKQCRTQAEQLAESQQKLKNLQQFLDEESQKTKSQKGYSSTLQQKDGTSEDVDRLFLVPTLLLLEGGGEITGDVKGKEAAKETQLKEEVLLLRARIEAYEQNEKDLTQEMTEIKGQSLEKEQQCRKVISICCNIPLEKVDEMLVPLTLTVESDGASLDLPRVAGFMSKVKQQDAIASVVARPTTSPKV
ncbi:MAG: hypothetical protein J3Q66DRAFT_403994 [Benniella sp.]|nr:MAG: hypothetical protein J3Q66DRAFT_403994 [Benniella sp.]